MEFLSKKSLNVGWVNPNGMIFATPREITEERIYIANNINLYNSITNSTLNLPLWNNSSCRNTTPRATRL